MLEQGTKDPTSLGYAYENLAGLIANDFDEVEALIYARDKFINKAKGIRIPIIDEKEKPFKIFISYSHTDTQIKDRLKSYLSVLSLQKNITFWDDEEILAGARFDDLILKNLESANLFLLLISPDYLSSEFAKHELDFAMKKNKIMVPILARPTDWKHSPIAKFQALPRSMKPITEHKDQDRIFSEITEEIKKVIEYKHYEEKEVVEKYKADNMVEVAFDNASNAYQSIDDKITSKKNLKHVFYIGKYPVTQKEWHEIMENNPSLFTEDIMSPVENVSWYKCIKFCNKLSVKYGLKKYYNINGYNVTFNNDADGFRLPTGAEWEYAARGGVKSKNYKYAGCDIEEELTFYAWYEKNSGETIHPVGQLKPNELDLYDMNGNVWEWCEDEDYKYSSARVRRGGGWGHGSKWCELSSWDAYNPNGGSSGLGFRIVCNSK